MNSYMSALKNLNNSLGNKNVFVANLNYEIGKILANKNNSNLMNIKYNQIINKSIYYYTTAYEIYGDYKEEFWPIFKSILYDLWSLNFEMGFMQLALKYGNEYLNDFEKYEKNLKDDKTSKKVAFKCLHFAEKLSKNIDALEICKKIFDSKLYDSTKEQNEDEDFSLNFLQFFGKYFKFVVSTLKDEKLRSIYFEWSSHYRNLFDDSKNELDDKNKKLKDLIDDIEKNELKDFKNYFEILLNYFNNNIHQNISSNVDLKNDNEEKVKNLRYIYLLFKDQIY
jgi:hypothetical protein